MGSHHSLHSQVTEDGDESSSESDSSQGEESCAEEEGKAEAGKSEIKTLSDEQEASEGEDQQECPHTQDTLTSVSQLFGEHEDTDPSPTLRRKSGPHGKSSARTGPKGTAQRNTPAGHHPGRKSHQTMRHFKMKPGKKHGCLTHTLMLGITTKLPTMSQAG